VAKSPGQMHTKARNLLGHFRNFQMSPEKGRKEEQKKLGKVYGERNWRNGNWKKAWMNKKEGIKEME